MRKHIPTEIRFDRFVSPEPNTGCWLWTGFADAKGYGRIWVSRERKAMRAHRVAFLRSGREIPKGMLVCHRCDVPLCVNPDHLFLGTDQDNVDDMKRKGRCVFVAPPLGERNPNSKLTDQQASDLVARHRAGEGRSALAVEFGISKHHVTALSRGRWRRWALRDHATGP